MLIANGEHLGDIDADDLDVVLEDGALEVRTGLDGLYLLPTGEAAAFDCQAFWADPRRPVGAAPMTVESEAIARLRADYQARLHGTDPLEVELARIQLERLTHGRASRKRAAARRPAEASGTEQSPTDFIRPWRAHLQALLTAAGNPPMRWRGAHQFECNHSPNHSSRSGAPVLVDLVVGSYWCRSCGERGGAAEVVSRWRGVDIRAARRLLDARYGSGTPKPEDLEVGDD